MSKIVSYPDAIFAGSVLKDPTHFPMTQYAIGVDLGGTNLRAASVGRNGVMLDQVSGATNIQAGREFVLRDIVQSIETLRSRRGGETLSGIGVGVPGFILMD